MNDAVVEILSRVLGVPTGDVRDELTRDDVQAWDSMTHLTIVLSLEQAFDITFEPEEAALLSSVGAIRKAVSQRAGRGQARQ